VERAVERNATTRAPASRVEPAPVARVIEPRRSGLLNAWREFWRYRHLISYFGHLFVAKRYTRTFLGWLWLPLRPGINLATRILVFGGLLGVATDGKTPYALFFLVTTSAWQLFSEAAYWSMRSVELNRGVLRQVYVPRLIPITSAVIPSLLEWAIYIVFVVLGVLWYVVRAPHTFYLHIGLRTLLLPAGLGLMILLGLGIGLLASGMSARARDVRFSFAFIISFLYFLTPVIYPLSAVPEQWRPLAELNPMTGAIEMVKDSLFETHSLSSDAVYVSLIAVFIIWIPGLWLFDRFEVGALHRT
jgi:lipopolysaccharide transport system permease protein